MKIWVIGAKGMLGRSLSLKLKKKNLPFIGTGIEVDITSLSAINAFIDANNKEITHIVNCAAYTQVDKAEQEHIQAHAINAEGPYHLALIAKTHNLPLTHVSTDYVFPGNATTPYREEDFCSPSSIYGTTKLQGEKNILSTTDNACIIRTSWLFGLDGKNFVSTMLELMKTRLKKILYYFF
jgi:dTDP-4-dehydrorhamnose reductase